MLERREFHTNFSRIDAWRDFITTDISHHLFYSHALCHSVPPVPAGSAWHTAVVRGCVIAYPLASRTTTNTLNRLLVLEMGTVIPCGVRGRHEGDGRYTGGGESYLLRLLPVIPSARSDSRSFINPLIIIWPINICKMNINT